MIYNVVVSGLRTRHHLASAISSGLSTRHHNVIVVSPHDTPFPHFVRNVVFEKFNTISIEQLGAAALNTENKSRTTEYYGNVGRLYYGYEVDIDKQILTLRNRIDTTQKILLSYKRPTPTTFELVGINEAKDSLHITLTRVDKHYPLLDKKVSWFKGK